MSMNKSTNEPTFRVSQITPEELQSYLREARRQRSLAFVSLLASAARLAARPFRRSEAANVRAADRFAPHAR